MGKTLILCEKPSQAADFSKGLGETFKRENNYYESENYIICNARGHLIKLVDPEGYDDNLNPLSSYDRLYHGHPCLTTSGLAHRY